MPATINHLGQPIGFAVPDWAPARLPPRTPLAARRRTPRFRLRRRVPPGRPIQGPQPGHRLVRDHRRDWPALKRAYEAWLDPANFDAKGAQKTRLSELVAGTRA